MRGQKIKLPDWAKIIMVFVVLLGVAGGIGGVLRLAAKAETVSTTTGASTAAAVTTQEVAEASETLPDGYMTEGTYKVGTDIPAGIYLLLAESNTAYFKISPASDPNDIQANDIFPTFSYVTVKNGEYLTLVSCHAVDGNEYTPKAASKFPIGDGMYNVGRDIAAGEYLLTATSANAYYKISPDARHDEIYANDIFSSNTYIRVSKGQFLTLTDCTAVRNGD